jgi:hypothetical protein
MTPEYFDTITSTWNYIESPTFQTGGKSCMAQSANGQLIVMGGQRNPPGPNVIKPFLSVIYECSRVLVSSPLSEPTLMFADKAKSIPKSGKMLHCIRLWPYSKTLD